MSSKEVHRKELSTDADTSDNLNFNITTGEQIRDNLFHSFSQFSVPRGSANFNNTQDIQNIFISRTARTNLRSRDRGDRTTQTHP